MEKPTDEAAIKAIQELERATFRHAQGLSRGRELSYATIDKSMVRLFKIITGKPPTEEQLARLRKGY